MYVIIWRPIWHRGTNTVLLRNWSQFRSPHCTNICVHGHVCLYWVWVSMYNIQRVHTLSSRNLPMLKGAYKWYVEVRIQKFQKKNLYFVWRNLTATKFLHTIFYFLEYLISDFDIWFTCTLYTCCYMLLHVPWFRLDRVCTKHVVYYIHYMYIQKIQHKYIAMYPSSRTHKTNFTSDYFGLDNRECIWNNLFRNIFKFQLATRPGFARVQFWN
jgi:hypothetical protein